jgi:hypothetical protein
MVPAAVPNRADGMYHVFCRQPVTCGDFGAACFTPSQYAALFQQLRACCPVNGPVDPTATQERPVGCIDDGIGLQFRDVSQAKFDSAHLIKRFEHQCKDKTILPSGAGVYQLVYFRGLGKVPVPDTGAGVS